MNFFPLVRPYLFSLDPEKAHHVAFKALNLAHKLGILPFLVGPKKSLPIEFCGFHLPNPVGLAAGLDKDGRYIDALAALGFGFLEIGTVTPLPQEGNPKPRMFRLSASSGIINRMGFNNDGVKACVERVRASQFYKNGGVIGINIGKNALTPIENATQDYLIGLRAVYDVASYVTVNISSPNTKNLRSLQSSHELEHLLSSLNFEREKLTDETGKRLPMFLKLAPDLTPEQVFEISSLVGNYQIDALITTNTTLSRETVKHERLRSEAGGLSGKPVKELSTKILMQFSQKLKGRIPLIGVGGIATGHDAVEKIQSGAEVVQLYSGLIFSGPILIQECIQSIINLKNKSKFHQS